MCPGPLRHAYLVVVVTVGWVPFRADTMDHALGYLGAMITPNLVALPDIPASAACALLVGATLAVWPKPAAAAWVRRLRQWGGLAASVLAALSLAAGTYNPFIYFRF